MADGTAKPIGEIKVGDEVIATDPETGRTEARPVTALIRHAHEHRMVAVTLSDGSKINATDHHPFWDQTTGGAFVDAVDLAFGDTLKSNDGVTLTVVATRVYRRSVTAFNLEISGLHTYY